AAKPTSGRRRPPGPVVPIQNWVAPYLAIQLDKVNRGLAGFKLNPIQCLRDGPMHGTDFSHAIHRFELSLPPVIVDQRLSLGVIGLKPRTDHLLSIVAPAHELGRATTIADASGLRRLEDIVIPLATIGAGEAASDAFN